MSARSSLKSGCVIIISGKILMVKQKQSGYWGFPKGHLEVNESLEECAIRETAEECGLIVKQPDFKYQIKIKDVNLFIVEKFTPGNMQIDTAEITDVKWFDIANIALLHTSLITKIAIKKIKNYYVYELGEKEK